MPCVVAIIIVLKEITKEWDKEISEERPCGCNVGMLERIYLEL